VAALVLFAGLSTIQSPGELKAVRWLGCVRWYLRFKLSFRPLVEMMAERGLSMARTIMRWARHSASVRASLEPVRTTGGAFVARRRNLRDPRKVGIFVTGGRPRGRDRGLAPQYQARCCRGQGVLSQGNQKSGIDPTDYHIGRVCGIAPSRARDEGLPANWPPTRSYAHRDT
jgi:hypothetical protein